MICHCIYKQCFTVLYVEVDVPLGSQTIHVHKDPARVFSCIIISIILRMIMLIIVDVSPVEKRHCHCPLIRVQDLQLCVRHLSHAAREREVARAKEGARESKTKGARESLREEWEKEQEQAQKTQDIFAFTITDYIVY